MAKDKDQITELLDSILVSGSYESAAKAKEVYDWWTSKDKGTSDSSYLSKDNSDTKQSEKHSG